MRRLLVLLPVLVVAGCGGSPTSGETPRDMFANACGSCHTLSAAGTEGAVGPNLDDLAPSMQTVLDAIAEGPGSMPADLLEGADAEGLAAYVANSAGE